MALSIKSAEADRLARQLADLTGQSITSVILLALREQLERERRRKQAKAVILEEIHAIALHCASLPTLSDASEDEILGYDENGVPA